MVRVLIVEDSVTMQMMLSELLSSDPDIQVVGVASDGLEGVNQTKALKPDIVTMDIRMPRMDGFEATRRIMSECPTPIVVVSASIDSPDLNISFNAMKAGALDIVEKPKGDAKDFNTIRDRLITAVKLMSEVKVIRRKNRLEPVSTRPVPVAELSSGTLNAVKTKRPALLAIGSSTGGPAALNVVLKCLPRDLSVPVVIVQHISNGFTKGLVDWLQIESVLPLKIGQQDQRVYPGEVYFAPDDHHLIMLKRGILGLQKSPPVSFVRPSVTVLFQSVAKHYGDQALGVILTGMGDDGAAGLKEMRDNGAITLAQDEASCVVFGMPKAAIELGAARHILPLEQIAGRIERLMVSAGPAS
jgi:two-component system, chemotaxis family, protein-glutamate methylesterase/glutaminase